MLRPTLPTLPVCRYCDLPGLHGRVDDCLIALRKAAAELHRRRAVALEDLRQGNVLAG